MHIIVITGATASGKSNIALRVAQRLGCDIISADSRQIYKHIPITTAAPGKEERRLVRHHLVEKLELSDYYSASLFEKDCMKIIDLARTRGDKYIVICGGTMMYIDALLYGLDELPTISDEVRKRVLVMYNEIGLDGLMAYLSNLDMKTFENIDSNNTKRVIHAVELCLQSGVPVSDLLNRDEKVDKAVHFPYPFTRFRIEMPREMLFERINRRVDEMVSLGMEQEARLHYDKRHLNSLNTIGFKEWFDFFDGKYDRETTIKRIAKNTRDYAKKQLTWLAKYDAETVLLPCEAEKAAEIILSTINKD